MSTSKEDISSEITQQEIELLCGDSKDNDTVEQKNVQFCGIDIPCVRIKKDIFVALKPLVEGMGMSWASQLQKINKIRDRFKCVDNDMVDRNGKTRAFVTMPVNKLRGWLFTINANRVKKEIREDIEKFQDEVSDVINQYFENGVAYNPRVNQDMANIESISEFQEISMFVPLLKEFSDFLELDKKEKRSLAQNVLKSSTGIDIKRLVSSEED